MGDRAAPANMLSELGDDYHVAAQPEIAMRAYQESLKIFREKGVNDPAGEARALANLANANTLLGRSVEAKYSLKDALRQEARAIEDPTEIMRSLADIVATTSACRGIRRSAEVLRRGPHPGADRGLSLRDGVSGGLSSVHEDQGDYGAALSLVEEGVKLARDSERRRDVSTLLPGVASVRRRRRGSHVGGRGARRGLCRWLRRRRTLACWRRLRSPAQSRSRQGER